MCLPASQQGRVCANMSLCLCLCVCVCVYVCPRVAVCKMPTLPPSLSPPHPPSSLSLSLSHALPVQNRVRRYQQKKALVLRHSGCACLCVSLLAGALQ
jgi:hypothetical protein